MASVAIAGSVMSSTAIVAICIPVVLRICKSTGMFPSKLMMPLSFAAPISGMMTLVATAPNLVVNAELVRQGEEGFGCFSITPIGITVLVPRSTSCAGAPAGPAAGTDPESHRKTPGGGLAVDRVHDGPPLGLTETLATVPFAPTDPKLGALPPAGEGSGLRARRWVQPGAAPPPQPPQVGEGVFSPLSSVPVRHRILPRCVASGLCSRGRWVVSVMAQRPILKLARPTTSESV